MGLIPATGTQIQMGRVRNAYGLSGTVRLRADLGAQIGITTGQIRLSADFGGRTTPFDY
jgi:ribosomal 30S subunit maturation factor RimM